MGAVARRVLLIGAVIAAVCAVAASSLGISGSAAHGAAAVNVGALPAPASTNPATPPFAARPPAQRAQLPLVLTDNGIRKPTGMTSDLDYLYRIGLLARAGGGVLNKQAIPNLPPQLRAAADDHTLAMDDAGRVQVYVYTTSDPAAVAADLATLGMTVQRVNTEHKIVQGMLPIVELERATAIAGVGTIAPPERPHLSAGSQMTQGDSILNADLLRSTYGVDGTGVKVGVLSNGAEGLAASIASGDLPLAVDTTTCDVIASAPPGEPANATDAGAGAEATAMAEIVHDLAPGAQIMIGYFGFNVSTSTSLDFMDAVTCLDQHNDVVVDDIGYYNAGPYDGTSSISQNTSNELANPSNPVRGYYTSNGNSAGRHYEEGYVYSGTTVNGAAPDFWRIHRFQATANTTDGGFGMLCSATPGVFCGDEVELGAGGTLTVNLQWNDPWGNSTNDYDLLMVDETGAATYLMSANVQSGAGSDPVEGFAISNPYPGTADFDVVIGNYMGLAAAKTFDMFVRCTSCAVYPNSAGHNFNTRRSSVANEADAGGDVMSLGAIDQADPGNDTIESFSSIGPTNDGRTKPDASAIDGVSVTGNGGFPSTFYGTSAAAPHAAGIAALILSCNTNLRAGEWGDDPAADRTALRNALLSTALDLGTAGSDNTFGAGRLRADLAAGAAGCLPVSSVDTDNDGCKDYKERQIFPATDPNNQWDFYSVPVPALYQAADPTTDFHDSNVSASDAQAVFAYFKNAFNAGTKEYDQDLNNNGIKDGWEYDRTYVGSGKTGPPDGIIAASDAQLAFAQFKFGYAC